MEYWRSRALRAESQRTALQTELDRQKASYSKYEAEAALRFEQACHAFESLIIEQLKKTPAVPTTTVRTTAASTAAAAAGVAPLSSRGPPPPPLSIDTTASGRAPHLALKPKRAPPVPPGKAFGLPKY
jgi:hypothetical protein